MDLDGGGNGANEIRSCTIQEDEEGNSREVNRKSHAPKDAWPGKRMA